MKYYVYISDSKVDMLLPQVPHETKKKVSLEFGFDLKALSAKRTSETETADNRISRLETVVAYIRENELVGTVDEPESYIEDNLFLNMQVSNNKTGDNDFIYFSGKGEKTVVGISGSLKHVIGAESAASYFFGSWASFVLEALWADEGGYNVDHPYVKERREEKALGVVLKMYEKNMSESRSPELFEIFAKRLIYSAQGRPSEPALLLATPLYVAKIG